MLITPEIEALVGQEATFQGTESVEAGVKVGDRIHIRRKITSLKEKLGRQGPMALLTYSLTYRNQQGDLLGINDETLILLGPEDPGGKKKEAKPAEPKIPDSPVPGREIPPFRVKVSRVQMMMYAAATWNPYQLHWDTDYARGHGFPDANVAGLMFGAYLAEMLARAAGGVSSLISLEYTNRAMAFPGDTLICKGKIPGHIETGPGHANCQAWMENQEGRLLVEGRALVHCGGKGLA